MPLAAPLPVPPSPGNALLAAAMDPTVPPDDLMALLHQHGADARDAEGHTALMLAVRHGTLDQVKALVPFSDRLAQNHKGESALHLAVLLRPVYEPVVERMRPLVTPQGVSLTDDLGRTPLMHMLAWDLFTPAKALLLLDATTRLADVQTTDHEGRTALMFAARFNTTAALDLLIPLSRVDDQDRMGRTALAWAVQERSVDAVKRLAPCSPPTVRPDGQTLLMTAAATTFNNGAMVQALLPFSDPNARNAAGLTALNLAIGKNQWQHVPDLVRSMDRLTLHESVQALPTRRDRERLGRAIHTALRAEQDALRAVIDETPVEANGPSSARRRL